MADTIEHGVELFKSLPSKIGLKFLRRAGRKAAELIRDEASRRAPRDTGALSDNMTIKTKKEDDEHIAISIGPAKEQFYGRFVDLGTKKMRAQPFLQVAIETKGDEAATVFAAELDKDILKHFK